MPLAESLKKYHYYSNKKDVIKLVQGVILIESDLIIVKPTSKLIGRKDYTREEMCIDSSIVKSDNAYTAHKLINNT